MTRSDARQGLSEFVGTLLLTATVVGSGIAAQQLTEDPALRLLINALSVAAMLGALIATLGPISGAYFNPLVSIADVVFRVRPARWLAWTIPLQLAAAVAGSALANTLFGVPPVSLSEGERLTVGTFASEVVATAGLLLVVFVLVRSARSHLVAPAVAAYVFGAIFFTSSAAFANPAITLGRMLTDTYTGIAPASAAAYVAAEIIGAAIGCLLAWLLVPSRSAPVILVASADR